MLASCKLRARGNYLRRNAMIGKFLFWLSSIVFVRLLRWEDPNEAGKRIEAEITEWNRKITSGCVSCDGKLVSAIGGSDGLFTTPHHFYRCTRCGNEQEERYSELRYEYKELECARIKKVDSVYRYMILGHLTLFVCYVLAVLVFGWLWLFIFLVRR